ncbi:MAG: hypothetical protein KAH03_01380 [Cocleimonas sp.]|nr:hypothetical protein [Cocleimonas sp.]
MKLTVNFSALHEAVRAMGAKLHDIELITATLPPLDPIDTELKKGIQVSIKDITIRENGLLSYKDRQVLLYIQDHAWNVPVVMSDGSQGKKYHLAYCRTLVEMNMGGRYNRYVVKHDISGEFYIDGANRFTKEYEFGDATLCVCKNCLTHLDYKNYSRVTGYQKKHIFDNFSLEEFFNTYQSYFQYQPKYNEGENKSTYVDDWKQQSDSYRASMQWTCERCQVILSHHQHLLHTHHINGVKSDNEIKNLQALCLECHATELNHGHMVVQSSQKTLLKNLRNGTVLEGV